MIYLLDTNTITDLIEGHEQVTSHFYAAIANGERISICEPVFYETERGLIWKKLTRKLTVFRTIILPRLEWFRLENEDWARAVVLWVAARGSGKQVSDMDVLIAALAHRIDGSVVTSDSDFDAFEMKRENWRLM